MVLGELPCLFKEKPKINLILNKPVQSVYKTRKKILNIHSIKMAPLKYILKLPILKSFLFNIIHGEESL